MIKIFMQFKIKNCFVSSMFAISKIHDCTKCSFFQCLQNNILKQTIIEKANQQSERIVLQNTSISNINYSNVKSFMIYEMNFKRFVKKIDKLTSLELEYWEHFAKNDIDISKIDQLGNRITHSYERYIQISTDFRAHCGEILSLETI